MVLRHSQDVIPGGLSRQQAGTPHVCFSADALRAWLYFLSPVLGLPLLHGHLSGLAQKACVKAEEQRARGRLGGAHSGQAGLRQHITCCETRLPRPLATEPTGCNRIDRAYRKGRGSLEGSEMPRSFLVRLNLLQLYEPARVRENRAVGVSVLVMLVGAAAIAGCVRVGSANSS